jgi:hypothetical protein
MPQGKCNHCRVAFRWGGFPPLRCAWCPKCGTPLERTSHQLRWPWEENARPASHDRALELRLGRLSEVPQR